MEFKIIYHTTAYSLVSLFKIKPKVNIILLANLAHLIF